MSEVLVVDDDPDFLATSSQLLSALGYEVATANSLAAAKEVVNTRSFQHVLLDLMLPDGSGLQLLDAMEETALQRTNVTIITGHPAIKNTIKQMYGPSVNYLIKPVSLADLRLALETEPGGEKASEPLNSTAQFDALVGQSATMQALYDAIDRVAKTSANVMLLGESGVGKELVANAIHQASGANGRFVAANCGAFNRELIGSELFGHEKGAFTGASGRKIGVFEQAINGTLFLDEITEMPLELQPNLLRVLEAKTFVRLGGASPVDVSCRIISATNRDERSLGENNFLRKDLLFRLAVFPITIPPLRDRAGDVGLLTQYFLDKLNQERGVEVTCNDETMRRLEEYDWPGNVRELRHTIHRAHIMSDADAGLQLPHRLGLPFSQDRSGADGFSLRAGQSIEEMEKNLITLTLDEYGGDKKIAAEVLGVSLKTLYNRLRSYGEPDGNGHGNGNGQTKQSTEL